MKTVIVMTSLFLGIAATGFAQDKQVKTPPAPVKAAFQKQYPGVKAKWELEDGNYEASFTNKNVKTSAIYDEKGNLQETETAIPGQEFPKAAKDFITSKKLGPIKETAKIVKPDGTIQYEAEIKKMDYLFDAKGAFLRAQKD
ncbi:MAG: PepSY-like domain-containing protein [Niabella sp.]|nr:PepSY-like domain-containing protein [Niabella sp.]